nr:hypothetical protein [Tanacetum cinerariifolium]
MSKVVEGGRGKKGVGCGSGRQENYRSGRQDSGRIRIWDLGIKIYFRDHLEDKVVVKEDESTVNINVVLTFGAPDEMLRLQGLGSKRARSGFCQDSQLESQPEYGGGSGSGGAGMMSQEMMRTAARMRRMRTIVRECWVNIDLYLADNGSFVTSSPVL